MGRGRNGMFTQRGKKGAMKRASFLQLGVGEKRNSGTREGCAAAPDLRHKNPHALPQNPPFLHLIRSAPGQLAANKEI